MQPFAEDEDPDAPAETELTMATGLEGQRLDRALATAAAEAGLALSRSRMSRLIADGAVADAAGATVSDASRKVKAGERFRLSIPPPADAEPQAEAIPLDIVHEDEHLIVVDKPPGMVVHPAPGAESGTLVNALLAHCGESLTGIGGARRPGIVHRIDKGTSGLLVVAKTDRAHAGLTALFAAREVERRYLAVLWGAPGRGDPRLAGLPGVAFEPGGWLRIEAAIARHRTDRKRMAVTRHGGRHAVTRLRVLERFGAAEAPVASLAECRLETGRTHQIRVHAAHIGHGLVGDPVYGNARLPRREACPEDVREALSAFPRQALHATDLGFVHPITHERLSFRAELAPDVNILLTSLRRNLSMNR